METIRDDEYLWCEKYRPQYVRDCILPVSTKQFFENQLVQGEVQNLLLVGPPGTGKTTVAKALCNELGFSSLVINASENGNIDTLRTTIRSYASTMSFNGSNKVVILDEADFLNSNSTQPALRNFMEEFSKNCRFILTANYANKIIDPLKSRCAVVEFVFSKADRAELIMEIDRRCKFILNNENIEFDRKILANIIIKYFPDFRKIINELQHSSANGALTNIDLSDIDSENINKLIKLLRDKKNWGEMRKWVAENISNSDALIRRVLYDKATSFVATSAIPQLVLILAEYDYKSGFVVDKEINLVAMLTEIMANVDMV